jgi:hypothetical protein
MPVNKRRNPNEVPVVAFAIWTLIGIFGCVGGLGYVWCKNDVHRTGARITALERELLDLRNKNETSRAQIAKLSSTKALQDRFDTGFIKLTKITDVSITPVLSRTADRSANELRAISNERTRK